MGPSQSNILTQKLTNWFVFFLAFPSVYVAGNSLTFYLFIAIIYRVGLFWKSSFTGKLLLSLFLLVLVISNLTAPYSLMPRHPGIGHILTLGIQYVYWILVAAFFSKYSHRLDLSAIGKYLFWGSICSAIGFYLLPLNLDLIVLQITFKQTRNSFIFSLLASVPICFIYLAQKYKGVKLNSLILLFAFLAIASNGRSGAIIIVIEMLLVGVIVYPMMFTTFRLLLIPMLILSILVQSSTVDIYLDSLADSIESVNPRIANLMRNTDDGDLSYDKSWLLRKLMIDKGLEILPKHPFFGVGAGNFSYYDAELPSMYDYERLTSRSVGYYNSRSAHNSYIQILTDFGLVGFIIFMMILLRPISVLFMGLVQKRISLNLLPIVALLGISIHFYAIAAITGAIPWFVIGLSLGSIIQSKSKL